MPLGTFSLHSIQNSPLPKRHFVWCPGSNRGLAQDARQDRANNVCAARKAQRTLREVEAIAAQETNPPQFDQGTQQRGFLLTAERLGSEEDARQRARR
jgi:hypothetical protein